ncbi:MKI67 FHA domain-interacting nucleolar phosphoprotein [Zeugodacus cucurbitae]|uniref:MKI67 FHA domain-interacting nucleolar phosphoprotein n=1 Tax=Zeugodacus cucurbitae TaxID=28588 RepID=A0A0A1X9M2_ZEUCU|nr:MKI67 FHA domain-interacting nucleolar phosphoprotein [Zeugodacus cucurbitae]
MPPVRKNKPDSSNRTEKQPLESSGVVSGQLDKKLKKQQQKIIDKRGIVFIKHLPHGFFEEQLKNYFEQFGKVTRLRLGRSRRTGGSKGYAFVEFEYPEVAEVAAETMDNYLMFKKVVKAAYIPPEKQLYNYFKTSLRKVKNKAGKDIYVSHKTAAIQRKVKQMNNWSNKNYQKRALKKLEKVEKLNQKYAHLGIDFSKVLIEPDKIEQPSNEKTNSQEVSVGNANKVTSETKLKKVSADKSKNSKALNKSIQLQDLLGNTLNDDSADEDYVQSQSDEDDSIVDGEESDSSTDEETYGFAKDSDSEESNKAAHVGKKSKQRSIPFGKSVKASKVDHFEKLIKRKPQSGAIQKAKKVVKPPVIKKAPKSIVQLTAAKEMIKAASTKKEKSAVLKTKSTKLQKKIRN